MTPDNHLRAAIDLAWSARRRGSYPFGAVLVDVTNTIVLRAEATADDVTAHAETNLVRQACLRFDRATLRDCTLYSSTEPCAMCAGAIYWAGIGCVHYALGSDALAEFTGANPALLLPCRTVFASGMPPVNVHGPTTTLDAAARAVHDGFWHDGPDLQQGESAT